MCASPPLQFGVFEEFVPPPREKKEKKRRKSEKKKKKEKDNENSGRLFLCFVIVTGFELSPAFFSYELIALRYLIIFGALITLSLRFPVSIRNVGLFFIHRRSISGFDEHSDHY